MPKSSIERTNSRKNEIISACKKLYETISFKEITIKHIADYTSFSRTSVYNYFQTKEEIFLEILKREVDLWAKDLEYIKNHSDTMSGDDFAIEITETLCKREIMLKLFSMNLYDIEENSRIENLVGYKRSFCALMKAFGDCLKKFFNMDDVEIQDFIYHFFPILNGLYSYAYRTEKQEAALEAAGVDMMSSTLAEMVYSGIRKLL